MEPAVGAFGHALAREHAGRVLVLAPVRVDAAGIGIGARQVFRQQEGELRAPVVEARRRDLGQVQVRERHAVVRPAHLAVAHAVAELRGGRGLAPGRPRLEQRDAFAADIVQGRVIGLAQAIDRRIRRGEVGLAVTLERRRQRCVAERAERAVEAVRARRGFGRLRRGVAGTAAPGRNFRQVTHPRARDDGLALRHADRLETFRLPGPEAPPLLVQLRAQRAEQRIDAGVVELARDRRIDRQRLRRRLEELAVARHLLAHVPERVLGAALLELVEHDEIREVEHVDLLELAGGAVVRGHHVHRQVDEIDDLRAALPDTRRLDHDQVEPGRLQQLHGVGEHRGSRQVLAPGRERAHENLLVCKRIHADTVAQQRAARAPLRRVHGDDGDAAVREAAHDSIQDFVGQRGLAGAAGAGDADDRRPVQRLGRVAAQPGHVGLVAQLEQRDGAGQVDGIVGSDGAAFEHGPGHRAHAPEHVLDHAVEAEFLAVVRRVDLLDAVGLEFLDLVRRDGTAATDHHPDVRGARGLQHVHHVAEILVVPALVAADRDAVGVFLDRSPHDVGDAAVVAEVHDLGAVALQDPADDVDGGIVAVKQGGRAHEAQGAAGGGRFVDPFGRATHRDSPARRPDSLTLQSPSRDAVMPPIRADAGSGALWKREGTSFRRAKPPTASASRCAPYSSGPRRGCCEPGRRRAAIAAS